MSTPCSGKTTFVNSQEHRYKTLHLFDHDTLGAINDFRAFKETTLEGPAPELPAHSCILGKCHIPDQTKCIYAVVLIEEEQLRKQIAKRKKRQPGNKWNAVAFSHPEEGYYALELVAKKYKIPIFKTFEEALDFIIVKIIENE